MAVQVLHDGESTRAADWTDHVQHNVPTDVVPRLLLLQIMVPVAEPRLLSEAALALGSF